MTFEFHTLGRIYLRASSGSDATAPGAKLVGMLAYLAMAESGVPVRRDVLLSLLWPEADGARARASLRQLVFRVRRMLGDDAIRGWTGGDALTIGPHIRCDAAEFEDRIRAGDLAGASALYRGEFLPGFFVPGASVEFERWLDGNRQRLHELALEAHLTLAVEAREAGEAHAAARWAEAATGMAPYESRVVESAMRHWADAGRNDFALRAFENYAVRLRMDLQIEPSDRLLQLAKELGANPTSPAESGTGHEPDKRSCAASRVAVLPFDVRGSAVGPGEARELSECTAVLLGTVLDGEATSVVSPRWVLNQLARCGTEVVDDVVSLGEMLGVETIVRGEVVVAGRQARIMGELVVVDAPDTAVRVHVDGPVDDVIELCDRLAGALLSRDTRVKNPRLVDVGRAMTSNLGALKSYVYGETCLRRGDYAEAASAFRRSLAADNSFDLARFRLGFSSVWLHDMDGAAEIFRQLDVPGTRLARREQMLLGALRLFVDGRIEQSEAHYRRYLALYPADAEARFLLAVLYFYQNFLRGRSWTEARRLLEDVLRAQPDDVTALLYLSTVMLWQRSETGRQFSEHLLKLLPENIAPDYAPAVRTQLAFAVGDDAERVWALADLEGREDVDLFISVVTGGVAAQDPADALRLADLLCAPHRSPPAQAVGHVLAAYLELGRGRPTAARERIDRATELDPLHGPEHGALLALAPFRPAQSDWLSDATHALTPLEPETPVPLTYSHFAPHDGIHASTREFLRGCIAVRLGNREDAHRSLHALMEHVGEHARDQLIRSFGRRLGAEMERAAGSPMRAISALIDAGRRSVPFGTFSTGLFSMANERFVRARMLGELGRPEEALTWLRTFAEVCVHDLSHLGAARAAEGDILVRLERFEEAEKALRHALHIWRDAEPGYGSAVDKVEGMLRSI